MNNLKYYSHLILSSKNKLFINLFIIIIIYIYNTSMDNYDYIECMKRAKSSITPEMTAEVINKLQKESEILSEQVNLLNQKIERLNETYSLDKISYQTEIDVLKENQAHLINENRLLKERLVEADQTIGKMATDNIDLRSKLVVQNEYIEGLRRNLELAEKHNEDLSYNMLKLEKKYGK